MTKLRLIVCGNIIERVGNAGLSLLPDTLVLTSIVLPFCQHSIFPDNPHTSFPFYTELHQQFFLLLFCFISLGLGPEVDFFGGFYNFGLHLL